MRISIATTLIVTNNFRHSQVCGSVAVLWMVWTNKDKLTQNLQNKILLHERSVGSITSRCSGKEPGEERRPDTRERRKSSLSEVLTSLLRSRFLRCHATLPQRSVVWHPKKRLQRRLSADRPLRLLSIRFRMFVLCYIVQIRSVYTPSRLRFFKFVCVM